MPINKVTQLVATVIDYPYLDAEHPVAIPTPLIIDAAEYYDPSKPANSIDVESFLSRLVIYNKLAFVVENAVFGGNRNDPAPGKVKELKITYSYNGITSTMVCKEKASVLIQGY